MPQYVVKLNHSPDQCPSSNSKVRERLIKAAPQMSQLAQQTGVKFIAGPLLLATEHESFAVVEAANIEAVNEFIMRSGFMQWNTVRISISSSMEQVMKDLEKMPPPLS